MEIKHILALISIVLFIVYFFTSKIAYKSYLLYVLLFLPLMDLNITPENYGSISVFDFLSWFLFIYSNKNFFNFLDKRNSTQWVFLLLSVLLFLGSVKSEFIQNSLFSFLKFFSVFIFSHILIQHCLSNFDFIKVAIKYLKIGVLLSLVFLFLQLILGTTFTFYPEVNPNVFLDPGVLRYPSFFQDPQKYAQYLSMLSFLFLMNKGEGNALRVPNLLWFILIVLAIFLTGSRLAFVGLCSGLFILAFSMKNKIRLAIATCCIIGYFALFNFSEYFSFFNRADDYKSSIDTRSHIWEEGMSIFYANPLLGIGIGNHHDFIVKHSLNGYYIIDNEIVYYGTESGYLQILIEFGLIGFILIFTIILTPVTTVIKAYKRLTFNIVVLVAGVASWLIAFATVNSLSDKRILIVLAVFLSLLIISKSEPEVIHA